MKPSERIAEIAARVEAGVFISDARADVPWLIDRLSKAEELLRILRRDERLADNSDEAIDAFLEGDE